MSTEDRRNEKLVIPYKRNKATKNEVSSAMSSSMPLAAMFMRNKVMAWAALFTTTQAFLNEPAQLSGESQPAWLSVVLALVGIFTCYMDIFMPSLTPGGIPKAATSVASSSVVSTVVETAVETATEIVSSVVN